MLNGNRTFESEMLVFFECNVLYAYPFQFVQIFLPEFFEMEFDIGFNHSGISCAPSLFFPAQVCEINVLVAVIDEITIKSGGIQVFVFFRNEPQYDIEDISFLRLYDSDVIFFCACRAVFFHFIHG